MALKVVSVHKAIFFEYKLFGTLGQLNMMQQFHYIILIHKSKQFHLYCIFINFIFQFTLGVACLSMPSLVGLHRLWVCGL